MFRPPTKYSEYLQDVQKSIDYILRRVNATTVTKIVAGTNVTISPVSGTGVVTINSTGGGSTPTLAQVTTAGNTTTNAITVGGLTISNGSASITKTTSGATLTLTPNASDNAIVINNNGYIKFSNAADSYIRGSSTSFGILDASYVSKVQFHWGGSASWINTGGNLLIGTTTDAGYKLDVNGTARVQGNLTLGNNTDVSILFGPSSTLGISGGKININNNTSVASNFSVGTISLSSSARFIVGGTVNLAGALGRAMAIESTIVAAANNAVLVGLDINPTFTNGAFTGVSNYAIRTIGDVRFQLAGYPLYGVNITNTLTGQTYISKTGSGANLIIEGTQGVNISPVSNVGIGILGSTIAQTKLSVFTSIGTSPPALGSWGGTFSVVAGGNNGYFGLLAGIVNSTGDAWFQAQRVDASATAYNILLQPTGGNVLVGTSTNAGYKLDVDGTARINNHLYLTNSSFTGTMSIRLTANNQITFGNSGIGDWLQAGPSNRVFILQELNSTARGNVLGNVLGTTAVVISTLPAQSSGTSTLTGLQLSYNINHTGTYSGIARGIYYNPTLTSLTGTTHRAIETVTGNVIFGSTSGNVLVGTTTDAGYKLDVNGSTRVKGAGATSATTALLVQNSTPANIFSVLDDGSAVFDLITSTSLVSIRRAGNPTSRLIQLMSSGGARFYTYDGEAAPNANGDDGAWLFKGRHRRGANSGIASAFRIEPFFAQEQFDTIQLNSIHIVPNIYVSGTATNVTVRGIYYNPTVSSLTGVVAHRAIETTSGDVIFNGGNVGIGTTTPTEKLEVNGNIKATSFIKSGGTSSQFLKADGSVDSTVYYAASNPSGYTTNVGTVTSVATGTGLSGGTITGSGTISLANTAVTAGAYTNANITVDAQGRITLAANGSAGTPSQWTTTGSDIYYNTGNVGIGTASPTDILHIVSGAAANIFGRISSTSANGTAAWVAQNDQTDNVVYRVFGSTVGGTQFGQSLVRSASLMVNLGGAGKFLIGSYSGTDLIFGTSDIARLRLVDSTGNFLVGTMTDAGNKLEVSGSINSTGYKINNTAGYTGILTIATNPPGQQNVDIQGGIIVNIF